MADYREISQQYAQGGIKAAILLNGGAAVAVLSQAAELSGKGISLAVTEALLSWSYGTMIAASTWILAFLSTRFYDKAIWEIERSRRYTCTSNFFMALGIVFITISLLLFSCGARQLARAFGQVSGQLQ